MVTGEVKTKKTKNHGLRESVYHRCWKSSV